MQCQFAWKLVVLLVASFGFQLWGPSANQVRLQWESERFWKQGSDCRMERCVCKLAKSRCPYFHQLPMVYLLACGYTCTSVASSPCSPGKGTRAACPVFSNFQRTLRNVRTVHWQTWTMQMIMTTQHLKIAEKNFVSVLFIQRWSEMIKDLSFSFLNGSEKSLWCLFPNSCQRQVSSTLSTEMHTKSFAIWWHVQTLSTLPELEPRKNLCADFLWFSVRLSLVKQISSRKWCVTAVRMVMTAFPPEGSDLWKAWLRCMLMPACSVRRGPVTDAE